jgi:hypothetical protein
MGPFRYSLEGSAGSSDVAGATETALTSHFSDDPSAPIPVVWRCVEEPVLSSNSMPSPELLCLPILCLNRELRSEYPRRRLVGDSGLLGERGERREGEGAAPSELPAAASCVLIANSGVPGLFIWSAPAPERAMSPMSPPQLPDLDLCPGPWRSMSVEKRTRGDSTDIIEVRVGLSTAVDCDVSVGSSAAEATVPGAASTRDTSSSRWDDRRLRIPSSGVSPPPDMFDESHPDRY